MAAVTPLPTSPASRHTPRRYADRGGLSAVSPAPALTESSPHPSTPEGAQTPQPLLCTRHARISVQLCPKLSDEGFVAVRARTPRLWGVLGAVYRPIDGQLQPFPDTGPVPYTDYRTPPGCSPPRCTASSAA